MHFPPKPSSLSRQSTPKKKSQSGFLSSLCTDLQQEKRVSSKQDARISSLESSCHSLLTRSVTPLSGRLKDPRALDLNQVCKGAVSYIMPKKPAPASHTERKDAPARCSPTPYRLSPSFDAPDLALNQRNIESLRAELQHRRELVVNLHNTVSRKQLEHKYYALMEEIEETSSRIYHLKEFNDALSYEISAIQKEAGVGYF
jgi:hypothetical protein